MYRALAIGVLLVTQVAAQTGQSVTPVVECVSQLSGGQYSATFGYKNNNTGSIGIAAGDNNKFTPSPADRGQTTIFNPGRVRNAFSVRFEGSGSLVWTVKGPDNASRTATASRELAGQADLNLSASQTVVGGVGANVTYTVANEGCTTAQNVKVEIILSQDLALQSSTASVGSVTANGHKATWTVGTVNPNDSKSITMFISGPSGHPRELEASVSFSGSDSNNSNNSTTVTINGQSSGSGNGGLESNGRLAQQIARRLLMRSVSQATKNSARYARQQAGELIAFIPERGPRDTTSVEASPYDLVGMTNASAVYGADYLDASGNRVGAVLGIVTDSGPYEHTKLTCDRLAGASLEEMRQVEIGGLPFVLARLRLDDGNSDYTISFRVSPSSWPYRIDSQYQNFQSASFAGQRLYNFQAWGATADFVQELVADMLTRLPNAVTDDVKLDLPGVYVRRGEYRNGKLNLALTRIDTAVQEVNIKGTFSRFENGPREEFSRTMRYADTMEIPLGNVYDISFFVNDDLAYFADGTWSHYAAEPNGRVSTFVVQPESRTANENHFAVERGVAARGVVYDYVTLLRHLLPAARPVDLSSYDYLEFTASGNAKLEVVPQKASIGEFGGQHRIFIDLTPEPQRFRIPFAEFGASFKPSDITTLVFNVLGDKVEARDFDVSIESIAFGRVE